MTPAPLLIVGAGGLARETLELVRAVNRVAPVWEVVGLLDDDPRAQGTHVHGVEVVGASAAVHARPDALVCLCVASPERPQGRLGVVERLALPASRYATLVHPAAVVGTSCTVGPGAIVHAAAVLTADVRLGGHAVVMPAVVLTHDDVVGEAVTFGAGARVAGGVTIEDGAYIGSGALLREGIAVGRGAVVGMGAVVTQHVPAAEVWAGVPARRLRSVVAAATR